MIFHSKVIGSRLIAIVSAGVDTYDELLSRINTLERAFLDTSMEWKNAAQSMVRIQRDLESRIQDLKDEIKTLKEFVVDLDEQHRHEIKTLRENLTEGP